MFGFLKNIADNIYAEASLALAPVGETYMNTRNAMRNHDGYLCYCIDDEIDSISAGLVLNELKSGIPEEDVRKKIVLKEGQMDKILSAKKDLDYFRARMYDDSMIEDIGNISRLLVRNKNNVEKVAESEGYNIDLVKQVKTIKDDYMKYKQGLYITSTQPADHENIKPFHIQADQPAQ